MGNLQNLAPKSAPRRPRTTQPRCDPMAPDESEVLEGVVDHRGRRVASRGSTLGGWRSAACIIGVEIAERFAYCGISSNLITYLTGPMRQSVATAAANVNAFFGAASMLPLLGAFVADSYLGRYRTILFASLLYVMALGFLTLSAALQSHHSLDCLPAKNGISCHTSSPFQIFFFFSSLYLVAIAQGGHKPCVQAFGADQFDGTNAEESKSRSSFFNWWYLGISVGAASSYSIMSYVQDNLNWSLGFGIPCGAMTIALLIFVLGTRTYRYSVKDSKSNPFGRIAQVFVAAARNRRMTPSSSEEHEEAARTAMARVGSLRLSFLDKAMIDSSSKGWRSCSIRQVEEAKAMVRLVPIVGTSLIYAIVYAQSSTFFTKQGSTMDRSIGPNFRIPPAALQSFISITIVLFIPIYDRVFVPIARRITGKPSGITMLQRIGIGMSLSIISMVVAALVEKRRLQVAVDFGLVDAKSVTIPMRVWWLVPQYILFGIADVFTIVGLQEFFYDQVPNALRSLGLALYLSILGVGNFLSSLLIVIIKKVTSGNGHPSWFSNNLQLAHLDYFYWLLAVLSMVGLAAFMYCANSYIYNQKLQYDEDTS
ncbi:hypothetical protein Scep_002983 [Stephania cephalantha]|uniref:Protein NRT1/ PTR FAMILY 5.10-like n=1 Tax=Stephania cephalantha TaxID=152367 RepID=A0AAP0LCL1_9MAGN